MASIQGDIASVQSYIKMSHDLIEAQLEIVFMHFKVIEDILNIIASTRSGEGTTKGGSKHFKSSISSVKQAIPVGIQARPAS